MRTGSSSGTTGATGTPSSPWPRRGGGSARGPDPRGEAAPPGGPPRRPGGGRGPAPGGGAPGAAPPASRPEWGTMRRRGRTGRAPGRPRVGARRGEGWVVNPVVGAVDAFLTARGPNVGATVGPYTVEVYPCGDA